MKLRTVAAAICLFFSPYLFAQLVLPEMPAPGEPPPMEEWETNETPATANVTPQLRPRTSASNTLQTAETNTTTTATIGTSNTTNIAGVIGGTTSAQHFTIFNGDSLPLFRVRGDGVSQVLFDQNGTTTLQLINSYTASTANAAARMGLQFTDGTALRGEVGLYGAGAAGTLANVLRLANVAGGPVTFAFGPSGQERFRFHPDGKLSIGSVSNGSVLNLNDWGAGNYAVSLAASDKVETNASQTDYGMLVNAFEDVLSGVTNSGSLYGTWTRAALSGAGTLNATVGQYIESGIIGAGKVNIATGLSVKLLAGTGVGIGTGYGVFIDDIPAGNDFAIYQNGVNDVNFFAGSIGVGVNAPVGRLHLHDTMAAPRVVFSGAEYLQSTNTSLLDGIGFWLGVNRNNNRQLWIGESTSASTAPFVRITSVNGVAGIDAISRDGSTPQTLNVAAWGGSVVIGPVPAANPHSGDKLYVSGNAHFTGTVSGGNIQATYQDVAEWVPSTTDLEPGTVVILNTVRNNEVMASVSPYDTSVAGVVSAQPGLSLGIPGEGKEQVATTGRVKVRVDARTSPIGIGDLLVTSALPGTAMKSEPMDINGRRFHQPGTIIGKALEPLDSGIGEILVLLSMQ